MSGMCPQVSSPFILSIKTPHFDYRVFKFYCYHAILKQLSTDFWLLLLLLWKLLYVFSSFNVMLLLFSCFSHVQLCNQMDCSTPGFPVPHHLLKFAQVHVHCIGDSIQASHPLMLSSPSALHLSQHQGLSQMFTSDDQNTVASASASVLPKSIQGWSPLRLTGLILLSRGLLEVFSSTIVRRHQFFGVLPSLRSSSLNCTWPLGRP